MQSDVSTTGAGPDRGHTVEELERKLSEALEQQKATGELIKLIGRSSSDLQPVYETLAENAVRLCEAERAVVLRFDGRVLRAVAAYNFIPEMKAFLDLHPIVPGRDSGAGRAVIEQRTIHIHDIQADPEYTYYATMPVPLRTVLAIPMRRANELLGVIAINRHEVRPFTSKQIALMETFADQAAVAIENAQLLNELQARTAELTRSVRELQALSQVSKALSSTLELEAVLDTIVSRANQLAGSESCSVYEYDEATAEFRMLATNNVDEELIAIARKTPIRRGEGIQGRMAITREPVQIPDISGDDVYRSSLREVLLRRGTRALLAIPLLRDDRLVGGLTVNRKTPGEFSSEIVDVLKTFANQAAIAIGNARLFKEVNARTGELARSLQELKSLSAVAQAVSSTLELKVVLARILEHACAMSEAGAGAIYVYDKAHGQMDLEASHNMSEELSAAVRRHPIQLGESVVGQCVDRRQAVQIHDLTKASPHPLYEIHLKAGVRALLAVPLLHQDEVVGALVVRRQRAGVFAAEIVNLLQAIADQSAIAIENARLFEELARKSQELEVASQHKSQFVANMSHELRTPLAAILGYAELMQEGFYEPLGEKSVAALTRIRSNGKHLLGLINTVLDIAKIESGQFSLNLEEYSLETVVETVRAAAESLAETKKLALKTDVSKNLPVGLGDEQRLTQVLLNLVGNAIKFTDAGEVCVAVAAQDGHFTVAVTDTGPGIPGDEQSRIFEQFHQVDSSNTKAKGGTGLGLAIAKRIVEMHGGRIWVESMVGEGATFQMRLPIRAEARSAAS